MKKNNVFLSILIINFLSCQMNSNSYKFLEFKDQLDELETYIIAEEICNYFILNNSFPESKNNFESHILKYERDNGLVNILKDIDYHFVLKDTSIAIVEYGSSVTDSLIAFNIKVEYCNEKKMENQKEFYILYEGNDVSKENVRIKKIIKNQISKHIKTLRNSDNFNLAINGSEKKKATIISASKELTDIWKLTIIYSEHKTNDTKLLTEKLETIFYNYKKDFEQIDYINIPVIYFENDQLKQIE